MTQPTVLIVDDNEEILRGVTRYLGARGIRVVTSDSPLGVTALIMRHEPDAVVLDVSMPALDGPSIANVIRNNPRTRDTRIVFYSALPEEELYALARTIPGSKYVPKSDGVQALEAAISALTSP